jgi:hypothetical protein
LNGINQVIGGVKAISMTGKAATRYVGKPGGWAAGTFGILRYGYL